MYRERRVDHNTMPLLPTTRGDTSNKNTTIHEQDDQLGATGASSHVARDREEEDDGNPFIVPEGKRERFFWLVSLPWRVIFYYTVPDCSKVFIPS